MGRRRMAPEPHRRPSHRAGLGQGPCAASGYNCRSMIVSSRAITCCSRAAIWDALAIGGVGRVSPGQYSPKKQARG